MLSLSLFLYFIRGCLCQIIFEMLRLKGQCFSGFIICQAFCFTNMINQLRISFVNVKEKYKNAWIFKYYQNLPSSISYCLFVRLRFIVYLHTVCKRMRNGSKYVISSSTYLCFVSIRVVFLQTITFLEVIFIECFLLWSDVLRISETLFWWYDSISCINS